MTSRTASSRCARPGRSTSRPHGRRPAGVARFVASRERAVVAVEVMAQMHASPHTTPTRACTGCRAHARRPWHRRPAPACRERAPDRRADPRPQLEVFDGVGHLFFWERPQRSAELLREHAGVHAEPTSSPSHRRRRDPRRRAGRRRTARRAAARPTATRRYVAMGSRALSALATAYRIRRARTWPLHARPRARRLRLRAPGRRPAAVLDHAGIGRAVIAGTSMGAHTAVCFALKHPERVAALAILTPAFDPAPSAGQESSRLGRARAGAARWWRRGLRARLRLDPCPSDPRDRRSSPAPAPVRPPAPRGGRRRARSRSALAPVRGPLELAAIAAPTLVVASRDDADRSIRWRWATLRASDPRRELWSRTPRRRASGLADRVAGRAALQAAIELSSSAR